MKVGVVTFHMAENYGSVLQAYALIMFLKSNGVKAEIVDYYFKEDYRKYDLFRWRQYCKRPQTFFVDIKSFKIHKKRKKNFKNFRDEYLAISRKRAVNMNELKEYNDDYDAFICGSDQIWNLGCTHGINYAYFLRFANKNKIKIAYAPSNGSYLIDERAAMEIADALKDFTAVSVREESLKKKLEKFYSRKIDVVLDPTLLLMANDYRRIESERHENNPKYIFIYILSGVRHNKKLIESARLLAGDTGLSIKFVVDNANGNIRNAEDCSGCSPSEFLTYIDQASYVITNSFHATVFSILFHKEFFSFPRNGSKSRIFDLLKMLQLEKRYTEGGRLNCEKIDYELSDKILMEKRKKSVKFLLDVLEDE